MFTLDSGIAMGMELAISGMWLGCAASNKECVP